ncbi:MAG: hypothetical protein OEV78_10185 [Spirochaetia bacterium]|nr:hypothetical protein [Spirochaetia bacterium]
MESLEKLISWCSRKNIVVIGGGPSLDVCIDEITNLIGDDTVFLLTDIVSSNFIKMFPESNRLIFTVEPRRHNYLINLQNELIACYLRAEKKNFSEKNNKCYMFHFDIDELDTEDSLSIKSPGTVSGAIIYWSLMVSKFNGNKSSIFLFGIDLCYIDNQVYNRLCQFTFKHDYWNNRESREWVAILKRTANIIYFNGFLIRSSFEFSTTKKKLEILLEGGGNVVYDYSPLGISSNFVKKVIPNKISSESFRDIIR